ncbi:MAG: hypothetical protein PHH98_03685 [Candidatus Gracilibacteria bacterium]|nr:hypothetical protein [Candidatus Gracilibacteria bacterium]
MKNIIILLISLVFSSNVYANSGTSTAVWTASSGQVECGTTFSHGITHYGIPNSNVAAPGTGGGTVNCTTHSYYSSSDHSVAFTYNNGSITACPAGERVVGWNGTNSITCRKYDDTPPSASDITSSILSGGYFRATNSLPINITGSDGGEAPIVVLQGQFENGNNELALNAAKSSNSDNNSATLNNLETNEDISKVDNYRTVNNYRNYTYNITNICDEAGNCTINPTSFNYNVYAGYINFVNSSSAGSANFVGQFADANTKTLTFTLKDDYGNNIIPVYESNGTTLIRNVAYTLDYNNSLYLNQVNKIGAGVEISGIDDSVYVNSSIGVGQNKLSTISSKANNDGIYNLNFKIYSPTYSAAATDGREFVDGNFNINNVSVKLSDKATSDTIYNNLNFQFKPLYVTTIGGSIITNGFIVGSTQVGTLNVTTGGSKNVYFEYGYYDGLLTDPHRQHTKIDLNYKKVSTDPWNISTEGYTNPYSALSLFGTSTSNLFTKLVQDGTLTTAEQNTYFATHISTIVGGKTSVYSSDIYGMDRYAGLPTGDNTSQRGVKITGNTSSQNQVDLVSGQSSSDINLLGKLEKSYLQRDIRQNAYSLIKEITPNNGTRVVSNVSQVSPGIKIGDVLYFGGLDGENVEINLAGNYSGIKTILVEGGNAYIKGDIIANNKANDVLGIIALKNDTSGNGGNVYIHPNVLEVDAILYADRAVVSYDGTEISPDNGGTYDYLSNQLYIYGTVFSNNTIGGSVQSPYLCPFYVVTCNLDTAQKYDMNYLRRGYITKKSATYEDYPVIINYNSLIQISPPPLFSK